MIAAEPSETPLKIACPFGAPQSVLLKRNPNVCEVSKRHLAEVLINAHMQMLSAASDSRAEVVSNNIGFKQSDENGFGRQVCELAASVAVPLELSTTAV